jgi:hypothetical protein
VPDVFLSYSHIDDTPPPKKGWVTEFQENLGNQLAVRTGQTYRVWFDENDYRKNNQVTTILAEAAAAKCFVSIISPSHLGSSFCRAELEAFLAAGGPPQPRREVSFVFKVTSLPVDRNLLEPVLQTSADFLLHYVKEGTHHRLTPSREDYHERVGQLADALRLKLEIPERTCLLLHGTERTSPTFDVRREARKRIVRPDANGWPGSFAAGTAARTAAIQDALAECELAVLVTSGTHDPELWSILGQAKKHPKVRRYMVWLAKTTDPRELDEYTKLQEAPGESCELYAEGKFTNQQFARAVLENLVLFDQNPPPPPSPPPPVATVQAGGGAVGTAGDGGPPPTPPIVHLVHSREDSELGSVLINEAGEHGIPIIRVPFTNLDTLNKQADNAQAILIASRKEAEARYWIGRVAPRLRTPMRGAVGFADAGPLEQNFRSLGRNPAGIFARFPL